MSPLQPADLIQKDFTTAAIGYDPDEVRAFLANVARSLEELDAPPDPTCHIETYIAAILAEARSAARETIDEALDEAVGLRHQTAAALEDLRWRANAEASHKRLEGLRRADEVLEIRGADEEPDGDDFTDLIEETERRLSVLDGVEKKMRRLRGELQRLHSVSSSLRKVLQSDWAEDPLPIRVVIVSTWNRFRSPIAAEILKRDAASLGCESLIVSSRGTEAKLGYGPPSRAVNCAAHLGIDITGHRSQRLSLTDAAFADLVVVLEERHAKAVRKLHPWANVVLLGSLRNAAIDPKVIARDGLGVLAQQTSKVRTRDIVELPGPFSWKRNERCIQEMRPHLMVLAWILAALPPGQRGTRPTIWDFEQVAKEKGA